MNLYKKGHFFSPEFIGSNSWNGYEHNCLFANIGGGQFVDIARPVGANEIKDCRGVAVADLNGDGRLDLVINNYNKRPTIYLNELAQAGNWIGIKLMGKTSNRDAVGARLRLAAGGKTMTRQVEAGSGYASQSAFPVYFGLGGATRVDAVEITWPSGHVQKLEGTKLDALNQVNRVVYVEEGTDQLLAEQIQTRY